MLNVVMLPTENGTPNDIGDNASRCLGAFLEGRKIPFISHDGKSNFSFQRKFDEHGQSIVIMTKDRQEGSCIYRRQVNIKL